VPRKNLIFAVKAVHPFLLLVVDHEDDAATDHWFTNKERSIEANIYIYIETIQKKC
jgi:hypothetical protein